MNKIQEVYVSILDSLKKGHRPRINLNEEESKLLKAWLKRPKNWHSGVCILCHLRTPTEEFHQEIEEILISESRQSYELAPFLMEALERHMIDLKTQTGNPPAPKMLKALASYIKKCPKKALKHPLLLIESLGGQNIYFKKVVQDLQWGLLSIFSKDQRMAVEIIQRLEKKWSLFS